MPKRFTMTVSYRSDPLALYPRTVEIEGIDICSLCGKGAFDFAESWEGQACSGRQVTFQQSEDGGLYFPQGWELVKSEAGVEDCELYCPECCEMTSK